MKDLIALAEPENAYSRLLTAIFSIPTPHGTGHTADVIQMLGNTSSLEFNNYALTVLVLYLTPLAKMWREDKEKWLETINSIELNIIKELDMACNKAAQCK